MAFGAKGKEEAEQLAKIEENILKSIAAVSERLDSIEKGNRKFLMMASKDVDQVAYLERENKKYVKGIMELVDQIDILLSVLEGLEQDGKLSGLDAFGRKITEIIQGVGLSIIPAEKGMEFDPHYMECLDTELAEKEKEDTVAAVLRRGYMLSALSEVIRPAQVIVYKGKGEKE